MFDWMVIGYVIVVVAVVFAAIVAWEAVRKKVRGIIFPPPHKEERGRGGGMVSGGMVGLGGEANGGGLCVGCGEGRCGGGCEGLPEKARDKKGTVLQRGIIQTTRKDEEGMAVITELKNKIEMVKRQGAMRQLRREIMERMGFIRAHMNGTIDPDLRYDGELKPLTERLAESRKLMDEIEAMHREYVTMLAEERLMEVGEIGSVGAVGERPAEYFWHNGGKVPGSESLRPSRGAKAEKPSGPANCSGS